MVRADRKSATKLWLIGYVCQLLVFALFLAAMVAGVSITDFANRDSLFVAFNCLVGFFCLVSLFSILKHSGRLGVGLSIGAVIGSIVIFAVTYFAFYALCVAIAFSNV